MSYYYINLTCPLRRTKQAAREHFVHEFRKHAAPRQRNVLFVAGLLFAVGVAPTAFADTIAVNYSITNISGSEWEYTYSLTGSVSASDLLAISFPSATSTNLVNLTAAVSGFTTSVLPPDTTIPADGEYDIFANGASSSFPNVFAATFTYSGTGTPGPQSFTLYDSSFATISSGRTAAATTATPEPDSFALLSIGFAALFGCVIINRRPRRAAGSAVVILLAAFILALPGTTQAQGPGGGTPPSGGGGTPPGGGGGTTASVSGFSIGPYTLLSSYRASVYQYYYTFTTTATNTNSAAYNYVLGTLTSSSPNTVVISGTVEFGLVPTNQTASGLTSFTILQDRRYNFDPSTLTWAFTGSTTTSTVGTNSDTVTISASPTSTTYGTAVNLTATVSPAGSGTITFYDGPLPIGTATLTSGTASLASVILPIGRHNLSAQYSGDTTYASSFSGVDPLIVGAGGAVTTCSGLDETALVACLANAFEATLTTTQLATAQLSYTLAHAEVWSNLPGPTRNGLAFSSLSSTQLAAALQLAQAALSSQGYARLYSIIGANNILGEYTTGYGAGAYYISILGTPSTTSPWQLQIGGHHLAFNHTFNGLYTSATPYFIGSEPSIYNIAGILYLPMQGPRDAAYALTRSVYGNNAALLSGTFDDVLTGSSGVDSYPKTYPTSGRGILYTSLTAAQQAQVKAMIEAWVTDMDSTTSSGLLSAYEDTSALANTYVGYSGTGTLTTQGDYVRVDGPRVWIEFCVQNGIVFNQSYHFHTIWRDKTADYGGDFLSQ